MNKSFTQEFAIFRALPQTKSPSSRYTTHLQALATFKAMQTEATQEMPVLYYEIVKKQDPVLLMLFHKHYQLPSGKVLFPGSAKQTILSMEKNLTGFKIRKYGSYYKTKLYLCIGGVGLIWLTGYVLRWVYYMRHSYDLIKPDMNYLENRF